MPDFPTQLLHRSDSACPTCGAPVEEDQLVCLQCGSRVALDYRRPPSWRVPAAILVTVVVLVLGGTAFAIKRIGDDAEREVRRTPVKVGGKGSSGKPGANGKSKAPGAQLVKQGTLYTWPRELEGFTVVLRSAEDRAAAEEFARSASEGAPARIGVIRADDFKSLPRGFFIVFAGRYADRAAADRALARLKPRFSGAFAQAVKR